MLWQDRNGNWFSTQSPIDAKIEQAMIAANANKVWRNVNDLVMLCLMNCSEVD